jgi:RNA polymerase sigma factor (sigma-70 family)
LGEGESWTDRAELEALQDPRSPRWRVWRTYLHRVASRHFRLNPADAEDLIQVALLKVARKLHTVRDPRTLPTFMFAVLRRVVLDSAKAKRRDEVPMDEPSSADARAPRETMVAEGPTPEDQAAAGERLLLVERALSLLCSDRPRDVAIFRRVVYEDESCKNLAKEVGVAIDTVYVIVHRIRAALNVALGEVAP